MLSSKHLSIIFFILTFFPFSGFSMKIDCVEEEYIQKTTLIPKHISDELLYSTIRIEAIKQGNKTEVGTGFIYLFDTDNMKYPHIPALITNKHVINNATELRFRLHVSEANGIPSKKILNVKLRELQNGDGIWHPDKDVDLFGLFLWPVFNTLNEQLKQYNREIYYKALNKSRTANLSTLTAVEEVLMVGYPMGLSDNVNNFPVFRRGVTSSHPNVDYNGKAEFLIDAACFPGSSGSPVFLYNSLGYSDNSGNINLGGTRYALLGILYAGPIMEAEGKIVKKDIPGSVQAISEHFSHTNIPINLGYVIKSNQLNNIGELMLMKFQKGNEDTEKINKPMKDVEKENESNDPMQFSLKEIQET